MSRILITSIGSYGDVFPYVGLGCGLAQRGHDVTLAMPSYYRDTVEREGLTFHAIRPEIDPSDRDTIAEIMDPLKGPERLIKWLLGDALRQSFDDILPAARNSDLLVSHPITFATPVVADHLRVEWVSTVLAPLSLFSAHDMPVLPPAPWLKYIERIPGAAALFVSQAKAMTRRWTKPVQILQREAGVQPRGHPIFEGQHSPHAVLALFSRVLSEPQPDWPPNVRVTGAIPYNGASGAHSSLSPDLESFLAAGGPPIVFTLGSSAVGAAGRFYEESAEALRRMRQRGVLLIGSHEVNRPRGELPDFIHVETFAPHSALFPRASVIVHQGGAGTLHQALASGRPTLVVPHAHDQPDNAYRVYRLGTSRTLSPQKFRATRVVRELQLLMGEAKYRERASEIATVVRNEDGVRTACDVIDRVLLSK